MRFKAKMVYNYPYSGKSLEECTQLLREDSTSESYSMETMAYALESLRDSPEDMRQYFDVLTEVVGESIKGEIDRGSDLHVPAKFVKSGMAPLEHVARSASRSQLLHVIELYFGSEVPKKWNDAVPELKIPDQFLRFK